MLIRANLKTIPDRRPPVALQHFERLKILWIGSSSYILPSQVTIHSKSLLYMICCTHCNQRYVGEIVHTLHTNLKQHLHNIQTQKLATHLVRHFANIAISSLKTLILATNIT